MATIPRPKLPKLTLGGANAAIKLPKAPSQADLSPEEEHGLLSEILRTSLGGVQYIGESLDKPGSAVRGFLATGDPSQLIHAVPFSETLGIDTEKKYSGRELLHKLGLASKNKPGFRGDVLGDLAGFGTEVALDPLWLLAGLPLVKGAVKGGEVGVKAIASAKTLGEAQKAFKAGSEAIKAGEQVLGRVPPTVPAALSKQIRQGVRGVVGLRIPGTKEPFVTFGAGSKFVPWVIDHTAYGRYSPIQWMRGLFSRSSGAKSVYQFGKGGIARAYDLAYAERMLRDDLVLELSSKMDQKAAGLFKHLAQIAEHHGGLGDTSAVDGFNRLLAELQSGMPKGKQFAQLFRESMQIPENIPLDQLVEVLDGQTQQLHTYIDMVLDLQNQGYHRVLDLGGHGELLEDLYVQHTARSRSMISQLRKEGKQYRERANFQPATRRKDIYRDVPGGSTTINGIAHDARLTGTKGLDKEAKIALKATIRQDLKNLGVDMPKNSTLEDLQGNLMWHQYIKRQLHDAWDKKITDPLGNATDDLGNTRFYKDGPLRGSPINRENEVRLWTDDEMRVPARVPADQEPFMERIPPKIERMVKRFSGMDPRVRERGIFDKAIMDDALEYTKAIHEWESTLRSAHHLLGQPGVVRKAAEGLGPGGKDTWQSLREVWQNTRVHYPGKKKGRRVLTDRGLETFVRENAEQLGIGADVLADPKRFTEAIDNLRVAPKVDRMLHSLMQTSLPQTQTEIGKLVDKVNSLWKGWLFTPWIAAHTRNLVSGLYQSWSDGHVSLPELLRGYYAAYKFLKKGGKLESLALLQREGILTKVGYLGDVLTPEALKEFGLPEGGVKWVAERYLHPIKAIREGGKTKYGPLNIPTALDPFAQRGWRKATPEARALGLGVPTNIPMETGERAYKLVEFLNRAGYAEALLKKGYTPSEIKHLVTRAQFDYSAMSHFERSYLSRAVLFYQWPRNNLPFTLSKLIDRPGGRTAQTLRALNSSLGQDPNDEYIPSFLRETIAARIGGTPQAAHFIRGSGIPVEDLNKIVVGSPTRTAKKFASFLHPALLAGPEAALNEQFFTGRELTDLEPITGNRLLDFLIARSPGSRVVSEFRGLADERKAYWQRLLNATTGIKTATYDTEYWRTRDLKSALERLMAEDPLIKESTYQWVVKSERETAAGKESAKLLSQKRKLLAKLAELRRQKDLQSQKEGK